MKSKGSMLLPLASRTGFFELYDQTSEESGDNEDSSVTVPDGSEI